MEFKKEKKKKNLEVRQRLVSYLRVAACTLEPDKTAVLLYRSCLRSSGELLNRELRLAKMHLS